MVAVPVLWLFGTSGVGKTTVGWELYLRLCRDGVDAGFVDIDQLGMCYAPPTPDDWTPEPAADPGRHRLQARVLDGVVANFGAARVRCVVVPGVTDPVRGMQTDLVPHAALTTCRLSSDRTELSRRLIRRDRPTDDTAADGTAPFAEEFAHADVLERAAAGDVAVDTTTLSVTEVVDRVRASTGWPGRPVTATPQGGNSRPQDPAREPVPGEILWLCGPAAVGKSSVGWQVYQQLRRSGVSAAFVDLDQLGFRRLVPPEDPGNHLLKAANLAAVWHGFAGSGADCLIAVGPLDRPEDLAPYRAALPAATLTLGRLHAEPRTLTDRVRRRGRGESPAHLAGDELIGQSAARLDQIADRSARILDALDGVGDLRIDTDDRTPSEIAADLLRRIRWPTPGH